MSSLARFIPTDPDRNAVYRSSIKTTYSSEGIPHLRSRKFFMSPPVPIACPQPALDPTVKYVVVGTMIALVLFGMATIQVYMYFAYVKPSHLPSSRLLTES